MNPLSYSQKLEQRDRDSGRAVRVSRSETTGDRIPALKFLELLEVSQPSLFNDKPPKFKRSRRPVTAAELEQQFGDAEVDALAYMSPGDRIRLPEGSFLGAIARHLDPNSSSLFWRQAWDRFIYSRANAWQIQRDQAIMKAATDLSSIPRELLQSEQAQQPSIQSWRDSAAQRWRFRNHLEARAAWLRILPAIEPEISSIIRSRSCGRHAEVLKHKEKNTLKLNCFTCGKRTCPACRERHRARTAAALEAMLPERWRRHKWRFITLTMKADGKSLRERITRLQRSFRRLRQQQIWAQTQTGGRAVVEVKWNAHSENWHVHLHILSQGKFMAQKGLSAAWLQATGDSDNVDIREVKGRERAIRELCNYIGKAPKLKADMFSDGLMAEWYLGIKRRRMMIGFGTYETAIEDTEDLADEPTTQDWEPIGKLEDFLRRAKNGEAAAIAILKQLESTKEVCDDS